jgi:hypothetical protein
MNGWEGIFCMERALLRVWDYHDVYDYFFFLSLTQKMGFFYLSGGGLMAGLVLLKRIADQGFFEEGGEDEGMSSIERW